MTRHSNTLRGVTARRARTASFPLLDWAEAQHEITLSLPFPRAARFVARRFGLPPTRARVVAELAGYPMEAANA